MGLVKVIEWGLEYLNRFFYCAVISVHIYSAGPAKIVRIRNQQIFFSEQYSMWSYQIVTQDSLIPATIFEFANQKFEPH